MSKSALLTPKLAARAVGLVLPVFNALLAEGFTTRDHMHIVVLDPVQTYEPHTFEEAILFEKSIGDPIDWEHNYKEIARLKARQVRKFGVPNQFIVERMPHLLKGHDIKYWGSALKDGIVVAASGAEPWFDQLISEMVASACQALCIDRMRKFVLEADGDTMDGGATSF